MWCCRSNTVEVETKDKPYLTYYDDYRETNIETIMKIIKEYFINYDDELYTENKGQFKNILMYKMEGFTTFIRLKSNNNMVPTFLNRLYLYDTKENLRNQLTMLSDNNLKIMRSILENHKREKEEQMEREL